jgi:Tol biopolymer transport system component
MMFTRDDPDTGAPDLWMQPLEGDGPPSRFTTDPDVDHLATFSPDGETVAWEAHSDGDLIVVRKPVGGRSEPELVGRWGRGGGTSDWSPDGRHLLYHSRDADGSFNLWMIPLSGDEEPFPLVESRFNHPSGTFSPDGRWLAYSSDETGQDELYLQRVEGTGLVGAAIRVSVGGGWEAQWREDGGELFFLSPDAVMAADTRLDRDSPAGTPRVLFSFQDSGLPNVGASTRNNYAVTPDGERIVLIVPVAEGEGGSATVVLDWASGVESGR